MSEPKKRRPNAAQSPRSYLNRKRHRKTHQRFDDLRAEISEKIGVQMTQVQTIEWLLNFHDAHRGCRRESR